MQRPFRSRLSAVAFSFSVLPHLMACSFRDLPPSVRSHALEFQRMEGGREVLSTPPLDTGPGANVTVVSVGRGDIKAFRNPTSDDASLTFTQLGDTHNYTNWQNSGTALYAGVDSAGGTRRAIRVSTPPTDEVTFAAVVVDGRRIADMAWTEVMAGKALTSGKVTTSGPATLVAFWWGDAGVKHDKQAVPEDGFQLVDAVLESGPLVQCAVAVKYVTQSGSYDVTWRAWPRQGAQLWIVAVE